MYGLFQTVFYFGYMALASIALGILCGKMCAAENVHVIRMLNIVLYIVHDLMCWVFSTLLWPCQIHFVAQTIPEWDTRYQNHFLNTRQAATEEARISLLTVTHDSSDNLKSHVVHQGSMLPM